MFPTPARPWWWGIRWTVAWADELDENPFRKPHYLLLNLVLGGSWGKEMDDRVLPQSFAIDDVRF